MSTKRKTNAFTMLEMLVVLIIVTVITTTMLTDMTNFYKHYNINQTIKKIGSDMNMIQTKSITKTCDSYIKLHEQNYEVYICDELYKKEDNFKDVKMKNNFDNQITINKYGNINRAGTITFQNKDVTKKMIFSIGEGRYRVE